MSIEDVDFEAMMWAEGAVPLGRKKRPAPAPQPPAPVPKSAPAATAVALAPAVDPEALVAARGAVEALRAQLMLRDATIADLRTQLADAEKRAETFDLERRAVARKLTEKQPAASTSKAAAVVELLVARGLEADEIDFAFLALADGGKARDLAELLGASDRRVTAAWLDRHLDLLCRDEGCPPRGGAVVVDVPRPRCDVCAGSDVNRAARGFFDACVRQGIQRVRLVGGSPAYRKRLSELVQEDGRVDLKLVVGTGRRTSTDARADQKHADLVILWGATILDHSVSELYDRHRGRVLSIPHRGIARMLELAAAQL